MVYSMNKFGSSTVRVVISQMSTSINMVSSLKASETSPFTTINDRIVSSTELIRLFAITDKLKYSCEASRFWSVPGLNCTHMLVAQFVVSDEMVTSGLEV